jgi:hypothetical protein
VRKRATLVLLAFVLASCVGMPGVVSYYVDKGVMQYYLTPSRFRGDQASVNVDMTFRVEQGRDPPAICNLTIVDRDLPRSIRAGHFELVDQGREVPLSDLVVLYVERGKREMRVTSTIDARGFRDLLRCGNIRLHVSADRKEYVFTPTRRFYATARDAAAEIVGEE